MAKFVLRENEENLITITNANVFCNENQYTFDVFFTNERLVMLKEISSDVDCISIFKSRGMGYMPEYEMVLEIPIDEVDSIVYQDGFNHIKLKNKTDFIDIYGDDLSEVLK